MKLKKIILFLIIICISVISIGTTGCQSTDESATKDIFELFKGAFNDEAIRDIFVALVKEFENDPDSDKARRLVLFWDIAANILRRLGMTLSDAQIDKIKEQIDDGKVPDDFGKIAQAQLALVNANVKNQEYIKAEEFENLVKKAQIKNYDEVQQAIASRNAAMQSATAMADNNASKAIDYVTRLHNGTASKNSIEFDIMVDLVIRYLTDWSSMSQTIKGKAANAALQLASFLGKDYQSINELQTKINGADISEETLSAITKLLNN